MKQPIVPFLYVYQSTNKLDQSGIRFVHSFTHQIIKTVIVIYRISIVDSFPRIFKLKKIFLHLGTKRPD